MIERHVNHTFSLVNDLLIPTALLEELSHPRLFPLLKGMVAAGPGLMVLLAGLWASPRDYPWFIGSFVLLTGFLWLIPLRTVWIGISRNDGSLVIAKSAYTTVTARYPRDRYQLRTEKSLVGRSTTAWHYLAQVALPNGKSKSFRLLTFYCENDRDTVNAYAARMSAAIENCLRGDPYDADLIVGAPEGEAP